jgi:hypothetical protein
MQIRVPSPLICEMKKIDPRYFIFSSLLLIASSLVFLGCRKERFTTDSSAKLAFSNDTVLFDTVFTTIGSTTQYLKVYNRNNDAIKIDKIALRGGSNSQYRINVDGFDGTNFENIEIRGNDSLFIFVEVTIDPGNINTPFIVEDFIDFRVNGNDQTVTLNSWGQDAYFHGGLGELFVLPCNEVWNSDKPHVLYGIVAVDSACVLTINAGTQVYCHAKSGLYVYKSNIKVNGIIGNEVVFQGDRLESFYADQPGQWGIQLDFIVESGGAPTVASISRGGIWIYQSPDSDIDYAIMKNGTMGIQVDTTGVAYSSGQFSTTIRNTKIVNMSGIGLWTQGGSVQGINLLVANCGEACGYFSIGGKYKFDNCTFGNYWNFGTRTGPAFLLNNYYEDVNENLQVRPLINSSFTNCIMYGNNALLNDFNEFVFDLNTPEEQQVTFNSCLIDSDINVDADNRFTNCVNGIAPPFCDAINFNFQLSSNSSTVLGVNNGVGADIRSQNTGDWKGCFDFLLGSSGSPCE